jgi:membrane fusion protein, multidrug efflux system
VDVRGTAPFVMRVRQGKVEKVQVQVGLADKSSETIEVLSGLQAGDTLLLGAAQGITPGTAVRVSAPPAPPVASGSRGI